MVCYRKELCPVCEKITDQYDGKCWVCESKKKDKARRQYFASLNGLTLEERIERLEKWQYEMNQNPPWIEPRY